MKKFSIKVPASKPDVIAKIKSRFRDLNCEESYGEIIIGYPVWYKNDFAPHLFLNFKENGTETIINGHIKMRTGVRIFCLFWFSFIGLAAAIIFASIFNEISKGEKSYSELRFVLFPVGMMLFMLGLIKFGAFIGRKNTEEILDLFFKTFPNNKPLVNDKYNFS